MGYNPKQALGLSELASRFQNIADTEISAAESAKFINSQLKAFGKTDSLQKFTGDFEKAQHVIDATNEVANNFAVGTNDLQNALTKAGSAMSVAGNSFEETIAMVTAGTEIMVGQPAKVGRGLRTIAINISKLAQEKETLSIANGKYTISLQDQNGEMLSTFDIMSQIGGVWDNLNETEQTALATQLAGKTQFEVFTNVMKNWETVVGNGADKVGALQTALDSNGSSMRENEKYLDSIEGKIQAFRSAWEQLSYHLVNSDFIKNVVDIGTKIITTIDKIVQSIGALPTAIGLVATAFGTLKLAKLIPQFLGLSKVVEEVVVAEEAMATAAQAASGTKGLGGLVSSLKFLTNPVVLGGLATLAGTIALMEIDKYFSLDSSIKRLDEYKNKLQSTTDEIEALKKKRDSDEGLTNAERTHLAVLEAEERSLERQVELEKQRIQTAFKKDASSTRNKRDEASGRHGPDELLNYQDTRQKELDLYDQIAEKQKNIAWAEEQIQEAREAGNKKMEERYTNALQVFQKELAKLDEKQSKVVANTAESASELAQYWETVSNSVDYDSLADAEKEVYDNIHKAFIESQIDASNLKDSYTDVADVLNSAMDSLGHDNLNLFDNIDISSITTVEDAINAIKEQIQGLGDDTEITFQVKDEDGEIENVTKKVSELTDEDYEAIIHFNETGIGEVESEADDASRDRNSTVNVLQSGADAVSGIVDKAAKDRDTTVNVSQQGAGAVQSAIDAIKGKDVHINIFKTIWESIKKHAKGKRKGEEGGLAWLGDEGTSTSPKPELVVSENGEAYLAGTTGWEMYPVKDSDTVYTYAETKKLLGGRQIVTGFAGRLPRYKKGKISNKTKKKKRKEFDKKLKELEHKRKVNHWTDEKYQDEYKKLYNKYEKYLKKDQKWDYSESREDYENERDIDEFKERAKNILTQSDFTKFKNDVNNNSNLTADEKKDLIQDAGNAYASSNFDRRLGNLSVRGADSESGKGTRLSSFLADVNKNNYLSKAEKVEYAKKAYQQVAEYNLKEYKNGVKTRAETLQSIKDYYNQVGEYDENYYKMLDELREADKEKELERLKTLKEAQDNSLTLAQKYLNKELSGIKKQIEADKEEADQLERLNELEKELAEAKNKKVRVYKEGVGFVYEQDIEAINKAEKALTDYKKSFEKTPLEERAEQIENILDLFDELGETSEIKELELALGVSGLTQLTGGNLGTNLNAWSKWIAQKYAGSAGYADLIEQLGNVATSQITSWLTASGNTQVSSSLINQYLNKHSFASGVLSAPGGLSRVGEKLKGELVWLGKGDSVYSNAVSKNLMEWGRYSPAQFSSTGTPGNQIFNFDKIVLPNVHNAETFYRELQNLPNKALQQSTMRV